jgi:electron transfer flavoprotein beta subunit
MRRTFVSSLRSVLGVKRVVDYSVKIRVKDNAVVKDSVKMSMNPFDEIAVEEAVRLKEKKIVTEIVAVSIGSKKNEEVLRTAMALGVDKCILITAPDDVADKIEPLAVAKIFAKLHAELKPDMYILGKQAIDDDSCTTAQLLAGILDIPQGTFASAITIDSGKVKVMREIDTGRQELELTLPAVLAADLRLNTPRYATLPNIMKARKKPIDSREASTLGVDLTPRLQTVATVEPPARAAGKKVKTVEELVAALKNEAKVL